jgi:hypothetical protein
MKRATCGNRRQEKPLKERTARARESYQRGQSAASQAGTNKILRFIDRGIIGQKSFRDNFVETPSFPLSVSFKLDDEISFAILFGTDKARSFHALEFLTLFPWGKDSSQRG